MARGISMTHRDFLRGNEPRQRMRRAWAAFFRDYDVFLCPAAASPAQPHDHAGERWERSDHGERPSRAGDRSDVLGGYFRASICCRRPSAPLGFSPDGSAVRRADRRRAIRRPHHDRVRQTAGNRVAGLRAAARMGVNHMDLSFQPASASGRTRAQRRNRLPANCSTITSRGSNGSIRASTPSWCATSTARAPAPVRWTTRSAIAPRPCSACR